MAYQRRPSTQSRQSRSEEDAHLTSPPPSASLGALSPPRPFFISGADRGSYSSTDTSNDAGSDSDREPVAGAPAGKPRNHRRRSVMNQYAPVEPESPHPAAPARDPFATPTAEPQGWSPTALYEENRGARAPPSAFAFPFQAYPGNPDPGTAIPGISRRSSIDSIRRPPSTGPDGTAYPPAGSASGYGHLSQGSPSATDVTHDGDLGRPYAPFMGPGGVPMDGQSGHSRRSSMNSNSPPNVYRNSAAGAFQGSPTLGQHPDLPRTSSVGTFRAPFLSPASRPNSSFWTPPSFPYGATSPGASGSAVALPVQKHRPPMPSSRLAEKLTVEEKPWIKEKDTAGRISWWITFFMMVLGVAGGAFLCYQGYTSVTILNDSELCQVMADDFGDGSLNTDIWQKEIQLGGFGNGEFEAMTGEDKNLYLKNGNLYIMPTLTSDDVDQGAIFDGGTLNLPDCTTMDTNATACSVQSSNSTRTVLNPVKSARINTAASHSIAFGKVEVRAKLPRGDWLWPAIWMLPKDSVYGQWPLSGEIDIMEARGNAPAYVAQGNNVVRSSLNYGILQGVQARLFGWQSFKRTSLAADFHTYTLEWTPEFMRMYIDSRLHAMLTFKTKDTSFYTRGGFPKTAKNGTDADVVLDDIWEKNENVKVPNSAPFDQEFYLIINLAAGGTSGWFPDGYGNKPWYDGSATAMADFAEAQDTWSKTWPESEQDRAFRIDYVKMWKYGKC